MDGIAVTRGPGLAGALLVGVQVGKAIAFARRLPLVGVDHLMGHLFAIFLQREGKEPRRPDFPYVALLVSGGHTALYRVDGPLSAQILGQTRDDAAGEAYDKVSKLLGLGYPGGPVVDRLAQKGDARAVELPLPMASTRSLDFSFSGLKTAVARHVRDHGVPTDEEGLSNLCAAFQRSVTYVLVKKAVAACQKLNVPRLVLGGGVAANQGLRVRAASLCDKKGIELFVPDLASCTDNAAMIAYVGALRLAGSEADGMDLSVYGRSQDLRRGKFPKRRH